MKKQWLSIVLVLCMLLCMAPATARAEESKTGTLKITVDISGVYEGDNVGDKTFSFDILRKYANYGHYKYVDITIKSGETEHTEYVPVEEGKYVVKQTGHATIDKYDWENASHQPGNTVESIELNVYAGKTERVTVHNFYKIAVTNEITELPIKINGYALNAKVGDIKASTEDQMRVTINKVTIKQRNASGGWDNLAPDATIQADIQYGVEILVNAKPGYTYASLTGDKVTVNGKEASEFENPSTQPGGDMRVFHEFEVLKVVKKVDHIEITTPPTKTEYKAGEKFDSTGMVVTAHYTDGTKAVLPETGYTIFYGDKLTQGQEYVTIQYNDGSGNSDIKVRQTITVGAYEGPHTHTYAGSPWYQDATSHWHQCTDSTCPDPRASATELASHTFVWKVDQAATTTQTGLKHEECTVCSYKRSENTEIPALRDYAVTVTGGTATVAAGTPITRAMEGVEVTVTAQAPAGTHFVKWVVKAGGVTLANETSATTTFIMPANDVTIEAEFAENPVEAYTLTVIKGTASVAAGTPITDKIAQNTVVTVTANAPETGKVFDKWVVLEGNVTLADATKATTTFTMPGNDVKLEATYKDAPPSHIHSYGTDWKYDGTNHWHECECGDKANIAAHSASEWIVDTAATETADGAKHKECTVCKKVLETAPIPATGSAHTHSYGTEWKYDDTNHWNECECGDKANIAAHIASEWIIDTAATETADGAKHKECTVCKKVLETAPIPATGSAHTHSYGTEWKYDDTNHWHECECGDKVNIAAHSASEWIVDTVATETADGAKHKECTVCKKVLETAPIPATGSTHTHSYGTDWKYDGTNHWHECECGDKSDTAAHSFQWVIDKAATKEATGIKHEECTVCGAKRSENTVIDKLPDGGNTGNTSSGDNNTDKPGKDDSTKSTQTGDSSDLIGWLAALFVGGGVLTLLGVSSKKRKDSEAE